MKTAKIIEALNVIQHHVSDALLRAQEQWNDLDEWGRDAGWYITEDDHKSRLADAERHIAAAVYALTYADAHEEYMNVAEDDDKNAQIDEAALEAYYMGDDSARIEQFRKENAD